MEFCPLRRQKDLIGIIRLYSICPLRSQIPFRPNRQYPLNFILLSTSYQFHTLYDIFVINKMNFKRFNIRELKLLLWLNEGSLKKIRTELERRKVKNIYKIERGDDKYRQITIPIH